MDTPQFCYSEQVKDKKTHKGLQKCLDGTMVKVLGLTCNQPGFDPQHHTSSCSTIRHLGAEQGALLSVAQIQKK